MGRDPLRHINGHNGFHQHRICGHFPKGHPSAAHVIQQQHTGLIAGQKNIFALLIFHRDTHPVTVRIGGQQQVCLLFFRIFHAQRHGFPDLRVRIGAGREIAVWQLLLFYHGNVRISALFQRAQHRLPAGSVQRRIHDGHIFVHLLIPQQRLPFHSLHESCRHILADPGNFARLHRGIKICPLYVSKHIQLLNLRQDGSRSLRGDLAAVCAVHLVSVVFGRIVGCRHHDACRAV